MEAICLFPSICGYSNLPYLPFARLINYTCGNSYIDFLIAAWCSAPNLQSK